MSTVTVRPVQRGLRGVFTVPGDKSIAHRALLLGAIARGTTVIEGFGAGADNRPTLAACRLLGIGAVEHGATLRLAGGGWEGLHSAPAAIDCQNSGTTMRLLAGVLAGRPFASCLDGDPSLRRRPMRRVIEPLARMGAAIVAEGGEGRAPLHIDGRPLHGAAHALAVASAQVKSALLLAGLQAEGETRVEEPGHSRDHTERLLPRFGGRVDRDGRALVVRGPQALTAATITLPGDFSAAAFLIVAALLVPGSEIRLADVGVNPTRTGLLDVLAAMGATVEQEPAGAADAEPRATLVVRSAELHAVRIGGELLLRTIDEFPIVCIAAARAAGRTELRDAAELRVKESDRIATMATMLRTLGVDVEELTDGLAIEGPADLRGATIDPRGDHRIAMAAAVAGLVSRAPITITGAECADVSFPGFYGLLGAASRGESSA